MPELPEVESVLRSLANGIPSLTGSQVQQVLILRESVVAGDRATFLSAITGSVSDRILRHGKYLFFGFMQPRIKRRYWMALHLRMTGQLFLVPERMAVARHTRLALMLDQGMALRFDDSRAFGRVWLVNSPEEVTEKLGPDALAISRKHFLDRIVKAKKRIKFLLLDQSFVAGVGNIYTDETLFRAQLHPAQKSDCLSMQEKKRLYDAMHGVLSQAVAVNGANIDGVFEAGGFPVAVYGRNGMPCPVCGSIIIKERLGQRGTHYCPVCQPFIRD